MSVRLYVIPGSHPARAAELMLRHKGIEYKPDPPGHIGPAFPDEWLAPLHTATPST